MRYIYDDDDDGDSIRRGRTVGTEKSVCTMAAFCVMAVSSPWTPSPSSVKAMMT
jgi:hypothetical protein